MLKWLRKLLPVDPSPNCGYGPFSLPEDHPFTRACVLHDAAYLEAHKQQNDHSLDHEDAALFYRWTMIARAAPTAAEQVKLMHDICLYWPFARIGGNILWDGKEVKE
jgi:hypothetical protein